MPVAITRVPPKKLTPEERVQQQVLTVSVEATNLATKVKALKHPDVHLETELVNFRKEVIKIAQEQAHTAYDDIVAAARVSYEVAKKKLDDLLGPLAKADVELRAAANDYYAMLERIDRENKRKAQEEQAERERQAVIQREKDRILLETQIENQLSELPEDAPEELKEKIMAPLDEMAPIFIAPTVSVSAPQTTGSMVKVDNWKGAVIPGKEMDVLRQVLDGTLPLGIIKFHEPGLNALAKIHQNKSTVPGLVFTNASYVKGTR